MTRPARVLIDLSAVRHNLEVVRKSAPQQKIMAIIKADAYGHGLERIAKALSTADAFGVACLEEAIRLRESQIDQPIVLLEGFFSQSELHQLASLNIQTIVHQFDQLEMLENLSADKAVKVWLKIDTGMHRLGFDPEDVSEAYRRLTLAPGVTEVSCLMTHFASAQEHDEASVKSQLTLFEKAIINLSGDTCLANSGAILNWPETHGDWVRPGLMLYGVSPFNDRSAEASGLLSVMSLQSELISVKQAKAGEKVGYGGAWTCPEDMPIGVVAMGYGDGYPRHARSGTPMLIGGQQAKLIGHPSMDMLTVDLRNCPAAKVGDEVILWGDQLPVETIAQCADTIPYELLCGMRLRVRFVEINC